MELLKQLKISKEYIYSNKILQKQKETSDEIVYLA